MTPLIPLKISDLGDTKKWQNLKLEWWDVSLRIDLAYKPHFANITDHISLMRRIAYGDKYHDAIELIKRRRGQMFLHSHLYYHLNQSIISDHKFDEWARELVVLQNEYPSNLGYYDEFFTDWDGNTGYHLTIPSPYRDLASSFQYLTASQLGIERGNDALDETNINDARLIVERCNSTRVDIGLNPF